MDSSCLGPEGASSSSKTSDKKLALPTLALAPSRLGRARLPTVGLTAGKRARTLGTNFRYLCKKALSRSHSSFSRTVGD